MNFHLNITHPHHLSWMVLNLQNSACWVSDVGGAFWELMWSNMAASCGATFAFAAGKFYYFIIVLTCRNIMLSLIFTHSLSFVQCGLVPAVGAPPSHATFVSGCILVT